jgi:hypothetical protein
MLFFHRVEIYSGFSLKDFSELRNSLAVAGIHYDYRIVDRNRAGIYGRSGRSFGTMGLDPKFTIQYYLYVHHKDYEHAMFLTSNRHAS